MGSSYRSENSLEQNQESFYQYNQDLGLNSTPLNHSTLAHSYQSHCMPDDAAQGCSSMSCYSSTGAQSTNTISSYAQASTAVSAGILSQDRPSLAHNSETVAYLSLLESKSLSSTASPLHPWLASVSVK